MHRRSIIWTIALLLVSVPAWAAKNPVITTTSLPQGQTTVAYTGGNVYGKWGTKPYTFTLVSGSLPTGLALSTVSNVGKITGTPTVAGTFSFKLRLTDSAGSPKTYDQQLYIMISATPVPPSNPVQITTNTPLPSGLVNSAYNTTIESTGGTSPYTYSLISGTLPPGLSLTGATGVISGTPTAPVLSSFTIRSTDSSASASTAQQNYSIYISNPDPAPTYLFQDAFESGNIAAWDSAHGTSAMSVQAGIVQSGTYALQIHYTICADSTNPACGPSHQDQNIYLVKNYTSLNGHPNGLDHFFIRGYVRIKTPETGGATDIQRKLYYFFDNVGSPSWTFVLTSFASTASSHKASLALANTFTGSSQTIHYDIATLNYDQWYSVEVECDPNTPGLSDGIFRVWVGGVLEFEDTAANMRGSFSTGIGQIRVGEQVDRTNYLLVDELRYWDKLVINLTGPIGP